ncbi:MAG TPA: UBP-type zinc finger domain-containing protein [Myxococcaceae bacterium]|nr:UBP-type zinc finger domain-containing protein [Myxococcaceae bacterium]
MAECTHVNSLKPVRPHTKGCEECLKTGGRWVHLRLCLSCGHVGCCDSSPNQHATKHFQATQHPIVQSLERVEDWGWCYVDEVDFEGDELPPRG